MSTRRHAHADTRAPAVPRPAAVPRPRLCTATRPQAARIRLGREPQRDLWWAARP
ncbi:hypothetical protein BU14_0286s0011 [Porphyra umbilicalis]|uniref:Uncharacterized protein n=1 Tax=Porphyra umbilicalis TaxID=2786 RepID=A0A1X6P0V7_PORUM|nr:hypothetical protein BU14_0286s0011 [Porphyra umbilicalis]|eukprot:OSX74498.1 hypothetical protein BU14_0286s0011 [Porphyra umbilicalis]